jgi:outer membrane receptor protein involved in Fe transport
MKIFRSLLILSLCVCSSIAIAQSTSASLTGSVEDPSKALISGVSIKAINTQTGVAASTETNKSGEYTLLGLNPGIYRIEVDKQGFKGIIEAGLVLHVQAVVQMNFHMAVGSASETVTVEGSNSAQTISPAVSTVIDRQFIENMPLSGRTLQNLVNLTPGVVVTAPAVGDGGQFSVNGQRADSNYFTVDGVSANFGAEDSAGAHSTGGTLPAFSANGTTSNLVSVDAVQEFRIQTSTFAPEFGRTPGAQVAITTRSGNNHFHGTAFEYLRNSALDASNWFNGFNLVNGMPLPKAADRQNDFGGVLGGPIFKDKTFFFFSYEGQRLDTPSSASQVEVPTVASRTIVPAALQPLLNAFPLPNVVSTPAEAAAGIGFFNASTPNNSKLNATSLRLDDNLTKNWSVFARYNYAPSTEAVLLESDSVFSTTNLKTQTGTVGSTVTFGANMANETLFNWSHYNTGTANVLTPFGGAIVPTQAQLYPASEELPALPSNDFSLAILSTSAAGMTFDDGSDANNVQRQINLIDNFSYTVKSHSLKFGVDYRRLTPFQRPVNYLQEQIFCGVLSCPYGPLPSVVTGTDYAEATISTDDVGLLFSNYSFYAQDTWRATRRLTLTYGARYDINPAPTGQNVQLRRFVDPYNLTDLTLAPAGTPLYPTSHTNVAPRLGLAYRVHETGNEQTTVRGGFGIFYDLGTNVAGAVATQFPFLRENEQFFEPFPLPPAAAAPVPFSLNPPYGLVTTIDPNIQIPRTYQWNVALDQGIGANQTVSFTYVGAAGRDLSRLETLEAPASVASLYQVASSGATSLYHALQTQYRRNLYQRLQALASYTWSHSIDTQSTNSGFDTGTNPNLFRASSDFDVRNAMNIALTYEPLGGELGHVGNLFTHNWSFDAIYVAQTAKPVDLSYPNLIAVGSQLQVRPNFVPNVPFFLYGPQYPGGRSLNPAAFTAPPPYPDPGFLGNVPRNFFRGFNLSQLDIGVHRQFHIHDNLVLQVRAEAFNVLNEPNFGKIDGGYGDVYFGQATSTLNNSLGSTSTGSGGLNTFFQIGGPRSGQVALKLLF